jgi:hypothetical protein
LTRIVVIKQWGPKVDALGVLDRWLLDWVGRRRHSTGQFIQRVIQRAVQVLLWRSSGALPKSTPVGFKDRGAGLSKTGIIAKESTNSAAR